MRVLISILGVLSLLSIVPTGKRETSLPRVMKVKVKEKTRSSESLKIN
jgi:hypothetical protein